VLPVLEAAGLSSRFDAVVTADDVYRGKPDPEGFLYAAQVLLLLVCMYVPVPVVWFMREGVCFGV
jgi:beta-phosphoglucomutase-like phosphatase (HAD superfamily)